MGIEKAISIKDMPNLERPREKLLAYGVDKLSNVELLSVLIQTGTKKASALDLAHRIIGQSENGLVSLSGYTRQELVKIKGIGDSKACKILAGIELGKRVYTTRNEVLFQVCNPQDVADNFMPIMRHLPYEEFHICLLNSKHEIFSHNKISMGSLNSSIVHPREVFAWAVKKSAAAILLLHNHPSGHPEPSDEDILLTRRLISAGEILGIKVLDHIIIGDGNWYSMCQSGDLFKDN